jgi:hypothetical protein
MNHIYPKPTTITACVFIFSDIFITSKTKTAKITTNQHFYMKGISKSHKRHDIFFYRNKQQLVKDRRPSMKCPIRLLRRLVKRERVRAGS